MEDGLVGVGPIESSLRSPDMIFRIFFLGSNLKTRQIRKKYFIKVFPRPNNTQYLYPRIFSNNLDHYASKKISRRQLSWKMNW